MKNLITNITRLIKNAYKSFVRKIKQVYRLNATLQEKVANNTKDVSTHTPKQAQLPKITPCLLTSAESTPLFQKQIKASLNDLLEQNYMSLSISQAIPTDYQQKSVRKLQKICSRINEIKPNTISGHYGRRTNKRLLINKIKTTKIKYT